LVEHLLYPADEPLDSVSAARFKRYQIMKAMGWTYQEYLKTPAHIVNEIAMFIRTEAKAISLEKP
jgi:hypothetical protein